MKFQTLLSITLLANVSVSNAQSSSPSDAPVDVTTNSPTGSPSGPAPSLIPFTDVPSPAPSLVQFPSFFPSNVGPTETPSFFTSPEPSLVPFSSFFPSDVGPTETPSFFTTPEPTATFEDCTSQPCDPDDTNSCSCRPGLECRQRGFETFLCSQKPRAERNRLSDLEGIGGAARGNTRGRADIGE